MATLTSDADVLRRTATRADAEARILHAQAAALVKSAVEMRHLADSLELAEDGNV
jgi:hypothetical protein